MGKMKSCVKALLKEKKSYKTSAKLKQNDQYLVKYVKKGFSFDLHNCHFFLKVILRSF